MRRPGVLRKTVLVPGEILERFGESNCPGKYHGCVVKVDKNEGGGLAHIQMTDIKRRICLPLSDVHQYVLKAEVSSRPRSKRSRETSDYSEWKRPIASPTMPVYGSKLEEFIDTINQECHGLKRKPGTKVWVNLGASNGTWPAVVWALQYCRKDHLPDVLLTYKPGSYLVNFYGEHSLMWIKEKQMKLAATATESGLISSLEAWGKKHKKFNLVKLATMEILSAEEDKIMEINRVISLYNMHTMANGRHRNACHCCKGPHALLLCTECERRFHSLCLSPPALTSNDLPGKRWHCPCCGTSHLHDGGEDGAEEAVREHTDKMGLTPDWIISAAAFDVFGLERPTVSYPFIRGLLDPCTNSKVAPNIPAEKLYDKSDNGLKLTNLWRGYYIILNPDFSSQVQWRFVNRAIDEVENESVPAIILICRNSTDTAFYQRLRPYPRVNLRRLSILFKDYSSTPIGFGVSIFCLAKAERRVLYPRFHSVFEAYGEPSIPIDHTFIKKKEFWDLLARLGDFTSICHRDHWVKCSLCAKWRIIPWDTIKDLTKMTRRWDCSRLNPPHSSCLTPLTKMESAGGHYVVRDEEDEYDPEFKLFDSIHEDHSPKNFIPVDKYEVKNVQAKLNSIITGITSRDASSLCSGRVMEHGNIDLRSLTALELSRKARMAANKAYLAEIGGNIEKASSKNDQMKIVSEAARGLASHVAKTVCFSEIEKARSEYQRVLLLLSKEEKILKEQLEQIQSTRSIAKRNLEAAIQAGATIERELLANKFN